MLNRIIINQIKRFVKHSKNNSETFSFFSQKTFPLLVKMHTKPSKTLSIKCKITIFQKIEKNSCIIDKNELKYIIGKIRKSIFPRKCLKNKINKTEDTKNVSKSCY